MAAKASPVGRVIREMADTHHGVVARRQLLARGFTRHQIDRCIEAGWLTPVHRGVYRVGPRRMTHRGRWMAAVLACGNASTLSHVSAAALWRLVDPSGGPVHVTLSSRARRRKGIVIHRTRELAPAERRRRHGIPVTSVERTLLDFAVTASPTQLGNAFEEAERLQILDRDHVSALCDRARGRPGTRRIRVLLRDAPLPLSETRSRLEQRFLRFCRDRAIPIPAVNVPLGEYEVDCLWPEQRVVAELDSWSHHGGRGAFEADRARDAAIQRMGHRIIRITHRRLK
jgi:predicted transcriptional regulator of viral defense system